MSKAPHPRSLRVVSTPPANPLRYGANADSPFAEAFKRAADAWDYREAAHARDMARWAAERREDAQAKRFWFRGWVATAWAWMRGEA